MVYRTRPFHWQCSDCAWAGGIGSMLSNYTNFRQWDTVGMLLIVVVVITMIIDAISGALRRRIREGAKARGLGRTP